MAEIRGFRPAWLPASGAQLAIWLGAYLLLHLAMRLAFSGTLQLDDAEQVVLAQELSLGYDLPQPPLYTWVYWGLGQVFGPGLAPLTWLKYLLIAGMFAVLWRIAVRLFAETAWRSAAVLAFLLLPVFAWQMHVGFTHTVLMMLACAMSFHALLRLAGSASPRPVDHAWLAVAVAVGLMSKYGYHIYLALLLAAALSLPEWRRVLLRRGPVLALVAAVLLALPYHLWLWEHREWVAQSVANKFAGSHRLDLGVAGRLRPVLAALEYLLPLLLVLIWAAPRVFRPAAGAGDGASPERLLGRFHAILLAVAVAALAAVDLHYVKARWMTPMLFLLPFWLLLRARRLAPEGASRVILAAVILSGIILLARGADFAFGARLGSDGRVHWPVAAALRALPPACLGAEAAVVPGNFLAAHVVQVQSGAGLQKPVYSRSLRPVHPPARPPASLAVIWDDEIPVDGVWPYLEQGVGIDLGAYVRQVPVTAEAVNGRVRYTVHCQVLQRRS